MMTGRFLEPDRLAGLPIITQPPDSGQNKHESDGTERIIAHSVAVDDSSLGQIVRTEFD